MVRYMMNNNKKLIYLFFDKTAIIKKNGETKTFPSGEYIATEIEKNNGFLFDFILICVNI